MSNYIPSPQDSIELPPEPILPDADHAFFLDYVETAPELVDRPDSPRPQVGKLFRQAKDMHTAHASEYANPNGVVQFEHGLGGRRVTVQGPFERGHTEADVATDGLLGTMDNPRTQLRTLRRPPMGESYLVTLDSGTSQTMLYLTQYANPDKTSITYVTGAATRYSSEGIVTRLLEADELTKAVTTAADTDVLSQSATMPIEREENSDERRQGEYLSTVRGPEADILASVVHTIVEEELWARHIRSLGEVGDEGLRAERKGMDSTSPHYPQDGWVVTRGGITVVRRGVGPKLPRNQREVISVFKMLPPSSHWKQLPSGLLVAVDSLHAVSGEGVTESVTSYWTGQEDASRRPFQRILVPLDPETRMNVQHAILDWHWTGKRT
ncbi:MAG TPA: hypothetical protein VMB52_02470 [Verrucomicrobiae bacterium]|nr:hypothetical protein [Verrucomicrobiae bacterium]